MNYKTITALTFAGLFAVMGSSVQAADADHSKHQSTDATTGTPDGSDSGRGAGVNTGADQGVDASGMPKHDDNRGSDAGTGVDSDMGPGSGTGPDITPSSTGDGTME